MGIIVLFFIFIGHFDDSLLAIHYNQYAKINYLIAQDKMKSSIWSGIKLPT